MRARTNTDQGGGADEPRQISRFDRAENEKKEREMQPGPYSTHALEVAEQAVTGRRREDGRDGDGTEICDLPGTTTNGTSNPRPSSSTVAGCQFSRTRLSPGAARPLRIARGELQ